MGGRREDRTSTSVAVVNLPFTMAVGVGSVVGGVCWALGWPWLASSLAAEAWCPVTIEQLRDGARHFPRSTGARLHGLAPHFRMLL